jgi:hypothetical protein
MVLSLARTPADAGTVNTGARAPDLFPRLQLDPAPRPASPSTSTSTRASQLLLPALGTAPPRSDQYELRPAGDGSGDLVYDGSAFTARIAADGVVTFHDRRVSLLSPLAILKPVAAPRNVPSLQGTVVGMMKNGRPPPVNDRAQNDSSFLLVPPLSPNHADPREGCKNCGFDDPLFSLVAWRFDVTDEVMRLSGQDPNRYAKARFLLATRDTRARRAAEFHAESIRAARDRLPPLLEQIAADDRRSPRERRSVLLSLRDQLDGDSPEAHAAARTIDAFVTARFPPRPAAGTPPSPVTSPDGGARE